MPPAPRAKWFSWTSAIAVGVAVGAGAFVYYHHVLEPPKRPNESREDEKDASRKISVVASPSSGPVSPGASSAVGAGTPQRTPNTGSPSTQSPRLSKKERQKLAVSRAQSELLGSGHFGEAADESCSDVEIPTDAGALRVRFERAAGNVERIVGKMTSADKLLVYGLYKQATTGKCALPKPRLLEGMTKHAKWVAWSELGDLPKASAMTEYVLLVEKLCGVTMATSSAGKGNSEEDHVSMGSISGRQFNQILENLEKIIAIELMYAAQALEFRRPNTFSKIIEKNHNIIRREVKKLENDRLLKDDIKKMIQMVENKKFIVKYDV